MKEQGQRGGFEARGQEKGTTRKASGIAVWSWVLYDFSNTIFSISILSYFLPLWLGDELGAGADTFNYLVALSALLVVLTAGPGAGLHDAGAVIPVWTGQAGLGAGGAGPRTDDLVVVADVVGVYAADSAAARRASSSGH